jgi:hypothetical protein
VLASAFSISDAGARSNDRSNDDAFTHQLLECERKQWVIDNPAGKLARFLAGSWRVRASRFAEGGIDIALALAIRKLKGD